MKRNLLRDVAVGLAALALVNFLVRGRGSEVDEPVTIVRTDLNAWELTGCYALRVDPWDFERLEVPGVASEDTGATAADSSSAAASDVTASPDAPAMELLDPPARVRLVADSTDEWGRDATTYRAFALGDDAERLEGRMRWLVRADTLWLLWSDREARAGVALFAAGDSLVGAARATSRVASITGDARAAAWPIDCATFEREASDERSRP